ncbi:hypothetical protein CH302_19360 [Rhodococcus sp. 15-2388-1-1a]|uniref:hypothetical protein n=1 Tax=Nocardiaceae TaxID=85025 RepID=UPI000565439D|nr:MULTISPECIES: hypothetical protein [Rhodococcus]OZE95100.1 hypothetical protein CH302_19360 [Rhodococcus sp. 15-2388-1-1a]
MPTIIPGPDTDVPALARQLLAAADHPSDVATDTSGATTAFVISDELAAKLGIGNSTVDLADYDEDPDDADAGTEAEGKDEAQGDEPAGHVDVNGSTESGAPTAPAEEPVDATDVDAEAPTTAPKETVDEPPRGGKGSGGDEWFAFLQEQGVDIPEDVTAEDRTELIALWDTHKAAQD